MSDPLHALAFSADRLLLRRLTSLLESIGCHVSQLAHADRALSLLRLTRPDFVIVDGDLPTEKLQALCRSVVDDLESGPPPALLLVVARDDAARVAAAFAGGADDVLHKPLVPGEVLARIRAATRLREQQWRRHLQLGNSDTLGCLPAPAWRALAAEVARQRTGVGACVAIELDYLQHLAAGHGRLRSVHLKAAAIERLQTAGGDGVVWGELEGGCLAALLTSSDDVAALAWAERVRVALAAEPFELEGITIPVTASIGVAALIASETTAEEQARGALRLAQSSGRDCVVSAKEWQNECRRREDEPAWLESATAWDIMVSHPLALFPEDTVDQALALLAQTQLAHIPVVDGSGKLLGLVSAGNLQNVERKSSAKASGSLRFVRAIMQTVPTHFDEETPARELQSYFASQECPVVVVTRQGRPLGLVYSHALASLEEHLTRSTFAARKPFSLDSEYLTTPEYSIAAET
jgi:DNA-binding response OmpR family regulator/predicted transcriptional regulator